MRNKMIIFIIAGLLPVMGTMFVQAQEKELSREEILQKSTEHFRQGEKFYNQGAFARADEEFKKAQELLNYLQQEQISVKPGIGELPVSSVKGKNSQEKEINYADYLKKALESSKTGDFETAISNYLKAIECYPNNADLHYNLAVEYLRTSQFDKAAKELSKVIQLNPEDKDAYYNLGVLHESYLGNWKLAKFYYSQYVKLAKREADVNEVKSWIRQIDKKIRLEKKGSQASDR